MRQEEPRPFRPSLSGPCVEGAHAGAPGSPVHSWAPPLPVTQEQLDVRCPGGHRATRYARCLHEIFAVHGDSSRWDGLIDKRTLYTVRQQLLTNMHAEKHYFSGLKNTVAPRSQDESGSAVAVIRERFFRRVDCLEYRATVPSTQLTLERFGPGALHALMQLVTAPSRRDIRCIAARYTLESRYPRPACFLPENVVQNKFAMAGGSMAWYVGGSTSSCPGAVCWRSGLRGGMTG